MSKLDELIIWLETAQVRWGQGYALDVRRADNRLEFYQDGVYRAYLDLDDDRPFLRGFADEDA